MSQIMSTIRTTIINGRGLALVSFGGSCDLVALNPEQPIPEAGKPFPGHYSALLMGIPEDASDYMIGVLLRVKDEEYRAGFMAATKALQKAAMAAVDAAREFEEIAARSFGFQTHYEEGFQAGEMSSLEDGLDDNKSRFVL